MYKETNIREKKRKKITKFLKVVSSFVSVSFHKTAFFFLLLLLQSLHPINQTKAAFPAEPIQGQKLYFTDCSEVLQVKEKTYAMDTDNRESTVV